MPSQCTEEGKPKLRLKTFNLGLTGSIWLETFRVLKEQCEIDPVYWTCLPEDRAYLRRHFPETDIHGVLDAIRGIEPDTIPDFPRITLDAKILNSYSRHQLVTMNMMGRMDPGQSFFYDERARLYNTLLAYWSSALAHYSPDVVVFSVTPHAIYDYVVYFLCKRLGIKTMLFGVNGLSRFFIYWDFEEGHSEAKQHYAEGINNGPPRFELSAETAQHFDHVSQQSNANYLLTYRRYLKRVGASNGGNVIRNVARTIKGMGPEIKKSYRLLTDPAPRNYLKEKDKPIELSQISGSGWRLNKRRGFKQKKKLARLYRGLCREVDLTADYIYVPLHYQPENTTCPNGDVFDNQLLMIRMLSALLPPDWKLLVKDYPNIFDYKLNGERARSEVYYKDLASIQGVHLVPLDYSSFSLTDNCTAVATVTGSAGWESVCRGKPVLAFGHAWYDGCEGVFHVPTYEQCRAAIERIHKGYEVDVEKVKYFLYVFDQHCIDACADKIFLEDHCLDPEDNVRQLARSMAEALFRIEYP